MHGEAGRAVILETKVVGNGGRGVFGWRASAVTMLGCAVSDNTLGDMDIEEGCVYNGEALPNHELLPPVRPRLPGRCLRSTLDLLRFSRQITDAQAARETEHGSPGQTTVTFVMLYHYNDSRDDCVQALGLGSLLHQSTLRSRLKPREKSSTVA